MCLRQGKGTARAVCREEMAMLVRREQWGVTGPCSLFWKGFSPQLGASPTDGGGQQCSKGHTVGAQQRELQLPPG